MTLVSRTSQERTAHDEQLSNLESSHLWRTVKSSRRSHLLGPVRLQGIHTQREGITTHAS